MVKNPFLTQKLFVVVIIALGLSGCKDKKKAGKPANKQTLAYLDMPLDSYEKPTFCLNDDVEAFILEEEQLSGPFDGTHVAYNDEQPIIQEYTLEQLDTKDEVQVVHFPFDSKEPAANQKELLKRTAHAAQEMIKEGKVICCKGHACQWHGTRAYNLALSHNRAHSIAQYLENEAGIPRDKLRVFGVGNDEAIAFENSLDGQAPNRRVEIYGVAV